MFTTPIHTLTDAEIAADIATLRTIVKDGCVNGMDLNWDEAAEMKALLSEYEGEQYERAHPELFVSSDRRAA
jgi:hypothetical protein